MDEVVQRRTTASTPASCSSTTRGIHMREVKAPLAVVTVAWKKRAVLQMKRKHIFIFENTEVTGRFCLFTHFLLGNLLHCHCYVDQGDVHRDWGLVRGQVQVQVLVPDQVQAGRSCPSRWAWSSDWGSWS